MAVAAKGVPSAPVRFCLALECSQKCCNKLAALPQMEARKVEPIGCCSAAVPRHTHAMNTPQLNACAKLVALRPCRQCRADLRKDARWWATH